MCSVNFFFPQRDSYLIPAPISGHLFCCGPHCCGQIVPLLKTFNFPLLMYSFQGSLPLLVSDRSILKKFLYDPEVQLSVWKKKIKTLSLTFSRCRKAEGLIERNGPVERISNANQEQPSD